MMADRRQAKSVAPQRVTICGGCGFLGAHLARALALRGHTVRALCRTGAASDIARDEHGSVEFVIGDCANPNDVRRAIDGAETVVNLIGTTVPESANRSPHFDVETNILPALTVLERCAVSGVKHIVLPSSGGTVYGIPQYLPIDEDHPLQPISAYGIQKLALEHYYRLYHRLYGLEATILRIANPFGPKQNIGRHQGIISTYCYRVVRGLPLVVWGDGSVVRDFLYIDDVTSAMVAAIEQRNGLRVFNVGSGSGTRVSDIIRLLRKICDHEITIEYTPGRNVDVLENVLDIKRICLELDWSPQTSLEEGMAKTLTWYREQA
jgi:UDP-glucose 4-epimerase